MRNDESVPRVRFGSFEADFSTQELWESGTKLKLARQPFEILEMLVAHPGQLVSRENLQRRLWAEDHFIDASHGLNAVVNKLRDTLHDSADEPKYIETLPRRGYRFIAQVEVERPASPVREEITEPADISLLPPPALTVSLPQSSTILPPPRPSPILLTASVALVVGSVLGVVLSSGLLYRRLDSLAGIKTSPRPAQPETLNKRLAPEVNERIAQSAAKGASHRELSADLWRPEMHGVLRPVEFRTIISGDAGNAGPQFSPDGQRIAFMSDRSGPWQIWMSNADGSDPKQVSFTDSGGTPRWSPDGRSIAFDAPLDGGTYVFVAPIDNPESARPLAEGRVPSFSRDGKFVYFASDRTGDWQVWKVPVSGKGEIQVTRRGGFAALESADGNVY